MHIQKKEKKNNKYSNIFNMFLIFICLQPLMDVISNLSNYGYINLNLITYLKPLFVIMIQFILLISMGFKKSKKYLTYYFIIFIYIILHSVLLYYINVDKSLILHEIRFIINIIYFIIVFLNLKQLYNMIDDKKLFYNKLKKGIIISIIIYVVLYLAAILTQTSWLTYEFSDSSKLGFRGWYYSGQIFGHLLCIAYPILLYTIFESNLHLLLKFIFISFMTIPFLLIGTKVPYFIVLIVLFLYILINIFFKIRDRKKYKFKVVETIFCLILIFLSISLYKFLPVYNNININSSVSNTTAVNENIDEYIEEIKKDDHLNNSETINGNLNSNKVTNNNLNCLSLKFKNWTLRSLNELNRLYSLGTLHSSDNRNRQLYYMNYLFTISDLQFKVLGIGYLNHPNYLSIERDIVMPLYSFGIFGAILFQYFIWVLLFKLIYYAIKNIKTIDFELLILAASYCMFFFISYYAGATYIYTQFSIILAIIMILLNIKLDELKKEKEVLSMKEYLKQVYSKSESGYFKVLSKDLKNNKKKFIITANPETLTMANTDEEVSKMLLDKENSIVPDGIAIVKACQILDIPVTERIAGVDIAEYLLKEANNQKKSIYLFGAKPEVINLMIEKIKKEYPNINILGYSDGYVKDRDQVFKKIIKLKPDVCLVALGIPHQEKLIYKYLDKFEKGIFVGVGGSFDVLSGSKKRAPKIFIKLNLEWFYRIICEPKRLKRFWNNNVKFILNIRKEKKEMKDEKN